MKEADLLPWFLHKQRFRERFLLASGDPVRPLPALIAAVCLWGCLLLHSDEAAACTPMYLSQAVTQLWHAPIGVQLIQTHALLAVYFYHTGRVHDGRYYTGAAAALALQCGLHQVRSGQPPPVVAPGVRTVGLGLPPPEDAVEEGERINAFWTVYAQDRVWAVALGVPVIINDVADSQMQVDTPWPLDMVQYELVRGLCPPRRGHSHSRMYITEHT
jgi:hypothetical protein